MFFQLSLRSMLSRVRIGSTGSSAISGRISGGELEYCCKRQWYEVSRDVTFDLRLVLVGYWREEYSNNKSTTDYLSLTGRNDRLKSVQ